MLKLELQSLVSFQVIHKYHCEIVVLAVSGVYDACAQIIMASTPLHWFRPDGITYVINVCRGLCTTVAASSPML